MIFCIYRYVKYINIRSLINTNIFVGIYKKECMFVCDL